MRLTNARVVLTGATGGLGEALARQLANAGASLLLTARDPARLERLASTVNGPCRVLAADLAAANGVDRLAAAAHHFGANVLINNAGIGGFGLFEEQGWGEVERILTTNLAVPVRLTQALLPSLRAQPAAVVVNIGSAFGSIPFAGFAAYSAAKAGLRAFSQGLRRELADTGVRVVHVSPRAIDTALNSPAVRQLNAELGNASDRPEEVASVVIAAIEDECAERVVGQPERLFAWLNGCAPALVDRGLRDKLSTIKRHAGDRTIAGAELSQS
ncbi:SDR family oxidoreductase [Thauera sp. WH-2]|uniref:SDR family oxidoreductase n=1 Tax=Thauera sp. WH-2 TaxID=3401574 RepID=UPI003AAD89DB